MPYIVMPPRVRRTACRLAAMTAIGVLASTGVAAAACTTRATSTVFTKWGDTSSYFLAPGGSFEGSLPSGFTLSGASLSAGNEPFYVHSTTDKQSLTIKGGGSVTTPFVCLDNTMPYMRFFAHQSVAGSDLRVTLLVKTSSTSTRTYSLADLANGSMPSWALTGKLSVAGGVSVPSGMTVQAALRIQAPVSAGSWQIDDVYVDPYAK